MVLAVLAVLVLLLTGAVTFSCIIASALAAILLAYFLAGPVALAFNDATLFCFIRVKDVNLVYLVRATNQVFHFIVGHFVMVPVLLLAFIPFISSIQGRILFNDEFNARLKVAQSQTQQRERDKQHLE